MLGDPRSETDPAEADALAAKTGTSSLAETLPTAAVVFARDTCTPYPSAGDCAVAETVAETTLTYRVKSMTWATAVADTPVIARDDDNVIEAAAAVTDARGRTSDCVNASDPTDAVTDALGDVRASVRATALATVVAAACVIPLVVIEARGEADAVTGALETTPN